VKLRQAPDEAALIGAGHLVPAWTLDGFDGYLAVDIGGSKIRAGIVEHHLGKHADLSAAEVRRIEVWKHADDRPSRTAAVARLIDMLEHLAEAAEKDDLRLAPFVGIACPGLVEESGAIARGAQNLPGNWHGPRFNLPLLVQEGIPSIGDHPTTVLMHNDAVVQGLSEVPFMRDVERWGIFTIGTGLGNACFTNRAEEKRGKR
jgi:predicted NBD/HSP70 family sugar kinase